MRYVLALLAAVNTWGIMSASLKECEPRVSWPNRKPLDLQTVQSAIENWPIVGNGRAVASAKASAEGRKLKRTASAAQRPMKRLFQPQSKFHHGLGALAGPLPRGQLLARSGHSDERH